MNYYYTIALQINLLIQIIIAVNHFDSATNENQSQIVCSKPNFHHSVRRIEECTIDLCEVIKNKYEIKVEQTKKSVSWALEPISAGLCLVKGEKAMRKSRA